MVAYMSAIPALGKNDRKFKLCLTTYPVKGQPGLLDLEKEAWS